MTTVLETCEVSPAPGAAAELSVPLSFFDMLWLHVHPVRRLLFYNYPCSKPHFLDTIVPQLKHSLSLTLKHYLPAAGKLLYPSDTDQKKPLFRYVAGDSVPLTVAESLSELDELTGNHERDADQFYDFMPQMPPVVDEPEHKLVPLLAFQITLFPGRGICLGFANHHSLGDGSSMLRLMLAWAEICKLGGDEEFLLKNGESLPSFDRSVIQDSNGTDSIYWKAIGKLPLKQSSFPVPTNRVRATFILTQPDINKLKDLVSAGRPSLTHVSTFTVATAHVWTCLVKSNGEETGDNEIEMFFFPADARKRQNCRIDPPVPANYFGNCIGGGMVFLEHGKVAGEDGFVAAAEAIAGEIKNKVNNKDEFLKGVEDWPAMMLQSGAVKMKPLGIAGSPKFDLSSADFGWGKAKKLEVLSIDGEKYSMSLCKSTEFEGGLEVGLSLPTPWMHDFASFFSLPFTS